ncbi:MAG TPA: TIGR03943 family protein [Desulfocapsa sulfexigens]|nr:TIGR03943 family protein [Desulfocapsa sulfexigens]
MSVLFYLEIGLLGLWAFFFAWLVTLGQKDLARLLHPGLWWLVGCASVILLLFLVVNLKRQVTGYRKSSLAMQLPSLLILLLPLLYFTHTQSSRFNADTFITRSLQTENGFVQRSFDERVAAEIKEYEEENKEVSITKLFMQARKYTGKEVEVVCQTFADEHLPDNLIMCYRYLITCCAADARPVFIFIDPPEETTVQHDKWIRVKGTVSLIGEPGREVPTIAPDSILYVKEPKFPFAF